MRILQIASGAPLSSGEPSTLAMHGLSCALMGLGHSVRVVQASDGVGPPGGDLTYSTEHLPGAPRPRPGSSWLVSGIWQALFGLAAAAKLSTQNARQWDVICFHATTTALLAIKVARVRGVPTLFRYQNPLLTQVPGANTGRYDYSALGLPRPAGFCSQLMESSVLRDASAVAVLSEYARQRITQRFGTPPTKVCVVPNGVDTTSFRPLPRSPQLLKRHGLRDTDRVVVCMARIAPYKNQMALIRAVPAILDAVPDAVFVFVGPIDDPAYFGRIQDFIVSQDLEGKIVFTGKVDARLVPQYHCLADVFVLPSLAEGMPLVLLEAMSCGRAIVASSLPQHLEVAQRGEPILLADPRSEQAFADAVVEVLTNRSLRQRLQRNARELAVDAYDWKVVAGSMLHAYEKAGELRSQVGSS
jgi:glycosyltransferase involved in cell wall biosynthesis